MSDTYINSEGRTIFTASFLRKRGHCCKSNCLHCPFGTTLRNIGIEFLTRKELGDKTFEKFLVELKPKDSVASSLLLEGFGKQPEYRDEHAYLLRLKGVICGVAYIQSGKLEHFILKNEFSDQGITRSYLEGILAK